MCPLFLASKDFQHQYVDLLMITESTHDPNKSEFDMSVSSHYCWIKNLNALVRAQITKHKSNTPICDRCLNHFTTNEKLEKHRILCESNNKCVIEMPKEEEK